MHRWHARLMILAGRRPPRPLVSSDRPMEQLSLVGNTADDTGMTKASQTSLQTDPVSVQP